jgi:uncharacterized membrane protein YdjX (TVP38/TMEM64 family)
VHLEIWVERAGPLAPLLLAVVCSFWATLCLPGPPILGFVGTLFADHPMLGMAVVLFGDTAATVIGFQIARRVARESVRERLGGKPWYEWLEVQVASRGLQAVFVVRMMPFFPNSLANYALGLTGLPFWPYLVASVAGSIPNLALYVFGSAGAVHLIREGFVSRPSLRGALAILLLLALLSRLLQRYTRGRLEPAGDEPENTGDDSV